MSERRERDNNNSEFLVSPVVFQLAFDWLVEGGLIIPKPGELANNFPREGFTSDSAVEEVAKRTQHLEDSWFDAYEEAQEKLEAQTGVKPKEWGIIKEMAFEARRKLAQEQGEAAESEQVYIPRDEDVFTFPFDDDNEQSQGVQGADSGGAVVLVPEGSRSRDLAISSAGDGDLSTELHRGLSAPIADRVEKLVSGAQDGLAKIPEALGGLVAQFRTGQVTAETALEIARMAGVDAKSDAFGIMIDGLRQKTSAAEIEIYCEDHEEAIPNPGTPEEAMILIKINSGKAALSELSVVMERRARELMKLRVDTLATMAENQLLIQVLPEANRLQEEALAHIEKQRELAHKKTQAIGRLITGTAGDIAGATVATPASMFSGITRSVGDLIEKHPMAAIPVVGFLGAFAGTLIVEYGFAISLPALATAGIRGLVVAAGSALAAGIVKGLWPKLEGAIRDKMAELRHKGGRR